VTYDNSKEELTAEIAEDAERISGKNQEVFSALSAISAVTLFYASEKTTF